MASSILQPQRVFAKFTYLKWKDYFATERPVEIQSDKDPRKTNLVWHQCDEEPVNDARGHEADYTLDTHGFQFVKHQSGLASDEFYDRAQVTERYLPESIELYKEAVEDVDEVYIVNWQLRTSGQNTQEKPKGANKEVHIDQSPVEVQRHIRKALPDRAEHLLQGRVRMINLWRPIKGPVQNWPLALCDARSVSPGKIVEFDRVLPHKIITARMVMHDPNMKWHYWSKQQTSEAILLKCYDSKEDVAQCIPHTSIELPSATSDTPARESIEIRAYLFTYPKEGSK